MKEQLLNEVESVVTKVDMAHYEQHLLLPQCFQKLCADKASEKDYMLEMANVNWKV